MESPVFKLEKVVRSRTEELQDFEGPLDLILFLLSKNKMEIQDISISLICDQYLRWLDLRQQLDLEVASEFAAMASHLVYLKTRMLLSIEDEEAKSEMEALIQSLEERRRGESYAYIKAMGEKLAPLAEYGRAICVRGPEALHGRPPEYSHSPRDLLRAMAELQSRAERKLPPPRAAFQDIARHEPYPVERKALDILRRLKERGVTRFRQLFQGSRSRSEVVATFLAVLELCRSHVLQLTGSEAECVVRQVGEPPESLAGQETDGEFEGETGNRIRRGGDLVRLRRAGAGEAPLRDLGAGPPRGGTGAAGPAGLLRL